MVAFRIEDVKILTQKLFLGTDFDDFLLREASITTFNTFTIDGHIHQGFYSEEELEQHQIQDFSPWRLIRPICFSLIKGKRLPGSFKIALMAEPKRVEFFLKESHQTLAIEPDQIKGLYLHIRYEEGRLSCITGTALGFFTLDKGFETAWDEYIWQFLKAKEIASVPE